MFRQFLANLFTIGALVVTEAWFLKGYFAGQPEFEPALAFLAAVAALFLKEPLLERLPNRSKTKEHDQALFEEFLRVLPTEPTIRTLKEHDFGNSLRQQTIAPLFEFNSTWESVEKEFLDKKLEKEKKHLFGLARDLANDIARRTVPVRAEGYISVYSDRQRDETHGQRPVQVLADARLLNEKASAFVPKYEAFIRLCRTTLAQ